MSVLEQVAVALAHLQEHLEHAAELCTVAAGHADDAHTLAARIGAARLTDDAEDIRKAVAVLRTQLTRVLGTAAVTASILRDVMHGPETPPDPPRPLPVPPANRP